MRIKRANERHDLRGLREHALARRRGVFLYERSRSDLRRSLTVTGVFNQTELAGHLPFYGIMALLLVWETGKKKRREWLDGTMCAPALALYARPRSR